MLVLIAGCSGGDSVAPPPTGSITGQVLIEGQGIDGVTVSLDGGATATTAGGGHFSFRGVEAGSYTVAISNFPADAAFPSTSQPATISANGSAVSLTFAGTYIRTATITGSVTAEGAGLGGVNVRLTGLSTGTATTTTTSNGSYVFTKLRAGSYQVEISGFDENAVEFSVTSRAVTVGVGESGVASFKGAYLRTAGISGRVTVEGSGLAGVTVSLSGLESMTAATDSAGQYAFTELRAGSYQVEISGFDENAVEFSVTSRAVTVGTGESGVASFEGIYLRTAGISGRVTVEGSGLAGVTVSLSGLESMTATTDGAGQYAFTGLRAGSYTVGISGFNASDYHFAETSKSVSLVLNEQASVPFDGTQMRTASIRGVVVVGLDSLANVTVRLSGPQTAATTTNGQGAYAFRNLRAGNYEVRISGYDGDVVEFDITSQSLTLSAGQEKNANFLGRYRQSIWRGIRVTAESLRAGYIRPSWNVVDTEIWKQDGSPACTAYTGTAITRVGVGDGLDREHIVALAEAWDSRPKGFVASDLRAIAEDHANLTLAVASVNRSKSDKDAADWKPNPVRNGRWFAERVVEVKRKYDLSVDPAERDRLDDLLRTGSDTIECTPAEPPPVRKYTNCAAMRSAGWNKGVNVNGGTYQDSWDSAEKETYSLNTARDGDKDGHACES